MLFFTSCCCFLSFFFCYLLFSVVFLFFCIVSFSFDCLFVSFFCFPLFFCFFSVFSSSLSKNISGGWVVVSILNLGAKRWRWGWKHRGGWTRRRCNWWGWERWRGQASREGISTCREVGVDGLLGTAPSAGLGGFRGRWTFVVSARFGVLFLGSRLDLFLSDG